jgi:two-component system cell cycle response regulator DivK
MTQLHALIVDDNQDNSAILAQLLSMEGIKSTRVEEPIKLEKLLPSLPTTQVVFLDLEMPKLNGYQVFNQFRSIPTFRNVPIVAYTVHVSEINTARRLGFHSFLAKPIDQDNFPEQLARILSGEQVWA